MAIKILGTTVINDSGNIENIGTFTASSFVGDGSQLTGVTPAIVRPVNVSPASGATNQGANFTKITLTGNSYLSIGGYAMAAAQWQVSTASDFASTVISTGDVAGTSVSYEFDPAGTLSVSTTYYWRVRYKDSNGTYSEWSNGTTFVTASSFEVILGSSYQGGIYIGKMGVSSDSTENIYGILLAPKASGQSGSTLQWKTTLTSTSGTTSFTDGWTNTANMANATHPAANYTAGLTISTYDDWYLPAKDELNLVWVNRAYLPSNETNDASNYWTSNENSSTDAWYQSFTNGVPNGGGKLTAYNVRAVRRFSIKNLTLGALMDGGYFIGSVIVNGALYGVLLAPKVSGESASTLQWKTTNTSSSGTSSLTDGWTNTNNMNNSLHPAAQYTRGLNIAGYTDWYLPSKDELNLALVNEGKLTVEERNNDAIYWSSSEANSSYSWSVDFINNQQRYDSNKNSAFRVRAVRRFAI